MTPDPALDCAIAPTSHARFERLSDAARSVFRLVLRSMQAAEDIAIPDEGEYIQLMDAIIAEAMARREYVRCTR